MTWYCWTVRQEMNLCKRPLHGTVVPLKADMSSRKGVAAVAARVESVLGLNPGLDLLGVVLVGTGANSKQVHKVTRDHLISDFGTDEVLFPMIVRHAEATAQACRERGILAHELERELSKVPKWWDVLRGQAKAGPSEPRSVSSVAEDLHSVAMEITRKIRQFRIPGGYSVSATENAPARQTLGFPPRRPTSPASEAPLARMLPGRLASDADADAEKAPDSA